MQHPNRGPSTTGTRTRRRARHVAIAVFVLAGLASVVAGASVAAAPPAPTTEADAALDWLGAQLVAHGNTLPGFAPGSSDWGLTADAVLAFVAAGRGSDAPAQAATDELAANVVVYTTWDPDVPGVRVAGATGKVLLALLAQGRDASDVGGVDLEAELRSLLVTTGAQAGRFVDRVPDPAWDASNGFGQTLAMLALGLTDGGVPAESVAFLLAQQCPAGGFRLNYTTTPGCVDDASADTDTTAASIQALLGVPRTTEVDAALMRGLQWLLSRQDATGAFGGTGPTAGINANSTGLIAQTLRAAGQSSSADAAASWITSTLQLTSENTAGGPAAADVGAVAYQRSAVDSAIATGIDAAAADQWRRSTSQAVLALGLAPYGRVDVDPVALPVTTTVPPTTQPSTTLPPTTLPPTTAPTTTDPVDAPVGGRGSGSTGGSGGTGAPAGASGGTGTLGVAGSGAAGAGSSRTCLCLKSTSPRARHGSGQS